MTLRGLLAASHPGPSAVVTIVALGLALATDMSSGRALLVAAAVLAGQLSIGWANDWLDATRGLDAGRADKPVTAGVVGAGVVRAAALVALTTCIALSLALGAAPAAVHLLAVASAWSYDVALKGTPASVGPYLLSFALLPSVATTAAGAGAAPLWASAVGACFGAGVHFANAMPDLAHDARVGVRGLPQRLGAGRSTAAAVGLLGIGTAVAVVGPGTAPVGGRLAVVVGLVAVAVALLAAVAVAGWRGHLETAYRAAMMSGLVVVALLLARGDAIP